MKCPGDVRFFVEFKFVSHKRCPSVVDQGHAPYDRFGLAGITLGEVDLRKRKCARAIKSGEACLATRVLFFSIEARYVVALGDEFVILPALISKITGHVVVVRSQVTRPAHAQGVRFKVAQIKV